MHAALSPAASVVGRYAPSPTGDLHLGNLRTALLAWLQARLAGGQFLIRMDDLDTPRNKAGSADQVLDDLDWLGLDWDGEVVYQSARLGIYATAFDQLVAGGYLFPCKCSRKDIDAALSAPHGNGVDLVNKRYPGTCRPEHGHDPQISSEKLLAWRFLAADKAVSFEDELLGLQQENLAKSCGDFVVRRKDEVFAYQLACAVDDGLLGVTDVVRGRDLLGSTGRQIAVIEALGYSVPRFWHVALMEDGAGNKLSKRDGSDSLRGMRENGATPEEVVGLLAGSVGLIEKDQTISIYALFEKFSTDQFLKLLV